MSRLLKTSLLVCACVIFAGVGVTFAATDGNFMVNPGLEMIDSGDPVGWRRYTPTGDSKATTISADARTGDVALLIDVDLARQLRPDLHSIRQAWNQRFSQDANGWGEPGETYVLSFYYKTEDNPNLRVAIERRLQPATAGGSARTNNQYTDFSPTADWTYAEVEFHWPHPDTHTDYGVLIQFFVHNAESGKVWIDDVGISRVDSEPFGVGDADRSPGTFYVSTEGDDRSDGSLERPWKSIAFAVDEAIAGDTIVFLPGEYAGILRPKRSGTEEQPITFKALERRTVTLLGGFGAEHAVHFSRVEHIRIEGFRIKPQSNLGRWVLVDGSKHIHMDDVLMEDATGGMPFHITHSERVFVRDSVIREYSSGNMARVGDSKYIVFEGNSISRAGHSPFQFYPDSSTQYVVVRGNVFHAAWGRNFEFFGTKDIVFEHNIITNAFDSGRSASTTAKFTTDGGIFRFNRVFRNWGGPIHIYPMRDVWSENIRIYNNVFDGNNEYGIALSDSHSSMLEPTQTRDVVLVNNVFSHNDHHGSEHQVRFASMGTPELNDRGEFIPKVRFTNNVLWTNRPDYDKTIHSGGHSVNIATVESSLWNTISISNRSVVFSSNINESPEFVNAEEYNHAPRPGSPLLSSGTFLTKAIGEGQGCVIRVEDASYFYDGYGIEGEVGDVIAIGSPDQIARIVKVDRSENTLTLDRCVRWEDGAPISFPWTDDSPAIGVFEPGDRGRPSVHVLASPFLVRPNEDVRMSVTLFGIDDPLEIRWQLGDGTIAYGSELIHRYENPYDYPIRVKVTTRSGEVYRGTGYVVVESERSAEAPFIHTTFNADDEDWWWLWKTYRPMPADWSRDVDRETGNGVLRVSDPGGGAISARIAPADWDIQQFPWIYLRYRILPGTPIGLFLEAFNGLGGNGRKMWLAATEKHRDVGSGDITHYVLTDDDEWHTLLIDARLMKQQFPDVDILRRLGIESRGTSKIGDGYWLDEFAILPEEALETPSWKEKLRD